VQGIVFFFLGGGGVKSSQCVGLTNLPPSYANFREIWELQPPENLGACPDM